MKEFIENNQTLLTFLTFCVAAIACGVYIWQAILTRRQIEDDYERSRRERTIDLLLDWFERLEYSNSTARKFAENIDDISLKAIWNNTEFKIQNTEQNKKYLKILFPKEKFDDKKTFEINALQSSKIRWNLISYLNVLEAILASWVNDTADRELIEEEFKYMFDHDDGTLKRFRNLSAGSYPCIDLFEEDMLKKSKSSLHKKYKLGDFSKDKQ